MKWDEQCDLRLHHLVCYINSTYHIRMAGWVGDPPSQLTPHCFADADFAGCAKTSRSTSGVHLCLLGPNTVFPLAGQSKKQGCVSHITPEAEIVASDHAMRTAGLPSLELWERLLCRRVTLLSSTKTTKRALAHCAAGILQPCDILGEHTASAYDGSPSASMKHNTSSTRSVLHCKQLTFTQRHSLHSMSGCELANSSIISTRRPFGEDVASTMPRYTKKRWVQNTRRSSL